MSNISELMQKSQQGDVSSQINLAIMYFQGDGIGQDVNKAVDLMANAAQSGDASAKRNLLTMLSQTDSSGAKDILFFDTLSSLADQDDTMYMMELGLIYCDEEDNPFIKQYPGFKSKVDMPKGLDLINKALELDDKAEKKRIHFTQFNRVGSIYTREKKKVREGRLDVTPHEFIGLLNGQLVFAFRAFMAAKQDGAPAEHIAVYKSVADAAAVELDSRLQLQAEDHPLQEQLYYYIDMVRASIAK